MDKKPLSAEHAVPLDFEREDLSAQMLSGGMPSQRKNVKEGVKSKMLSLYYTSALRQKIEDIPEAES